METQSTAAPTGNSQPIPLLLKSNVSTKADLSLVVEEQRNTGRDINLTALACAVIMKAIEDLTNPFKAERGGRGAAIANLQSAKEFLCAPNRDLSFWCALCGMNAPAVIDAANKMIKEPN